MFKLYSKKIVNAFFTLTLLICIYTYINNFRPHLIILKAMGQLPWLRVEYPFMYIYINILSNMCHDLHLVMCL